MLPKYNKKWTKYLKSLDRQTASIWTQFITGHNYLGYHRHNTGEIEDATCRKCGDEVETAWHLLKHCEALETGRMYALFEDEIDQLPDPDERLAAFVQMNIFRLLRNPNEADPWANRQQH